ncbi:MAG: tRNA lysidine(34) synthetase TilS [Elusimicrobiota bacterium]|nr:tRNA lysidine(34) synthetase TilS [Elusimicrobiota bacterium]
MSEVIWEKFLKTVKKNHLVEPQDRILAAVSGGPDSVCMVYLLKKLQKVFVFDLGMIYVNHQLREEQELKKEIEFVKNLGEELNIPTFITEIDLWPATPTSTLSDLAAVVEASEQQALASGGKRDGQVTVRDRSNIESKARNLRYAQLCRVATEHRYNKIATGHTLNDNAETVLLNIVRSSNTEGILGIPLVRADQDKRISIIRPMLGIKKEEIMSFLKTNRIKFCVDITNKDISYSRNFIRMKILPLLEKLNPSILTHLSNLAISSYQKQLYIEDVIRRLLKKIVVKKLIGREKIQLQVDLIEFFKYNMFLQQQILSKVLIDFIKRNNYSKLIDDILEFLESKKAVFISGNLEVKKSKRWLRLKLKK